MPTNSQKPWGDTLRTSTPEVFLPSAADFTDMSFNEQSDSTKLLFAQTVILRLRDRGLKPKFGFSVRALHVNVHSGLLAREEVKPIAAVTEYGGAHWGSLRYPRNKGT